MRTKLTGGGSDRLVGGNGIDSLTGGNGDDVFVYRHASNAAKGDVITDFSRSDGDMIDLGQIDANTTGGGNQAFKFIGAKAFSETAGELNYQKGVVSGDVNGDAKADFHIEITHHHALNAHDFIL